jgi:hypothetical protein
MAESLSPAQGLRIASQPGRKESRGYRIDALDRLGSMLAITPFAEDRCIKSTKINKSSASSASQKKYANRIILILSLQDQTIKLV